MYHLLKTLLTHLVKTPFLFVSVRFKTLLRNLFQNRKLKNDFILEVGCGNRGNGTVNMDLFIGRTSHYVGKIRPLNINNFIQADAHCLPFRDNAFDAVRCVHVLEHLKNPVKALGDFKRVSRKYVCVCVPSRFAFDRTVTHLYTWIPWTLNNLMKLFFESSKVTWTPYELIGIGVKTKDDITAEISKV